MRNIRAAAIGLAGEYEVGFRQTPELCRATVRALRDAGADVSDSGIVLYDSASALRAEAGRPTSRPGGLKSASTGDG